MLYCTPETMMSSRNQNHLLRLHVCFLGDLEPAIEIEDGYIEQPFFLLFLLENVYNFDGGWSIDLRPPSLRKTRWRPLSLMNMNETNMYEKHLTQL